MAEPKPLAFGRGTAAMAWIPSIRTGEWSTDLLGRPRREGREGIRRFGRGGSPRPQSDFFCQNKSKIDEQQMLFADAFAAYGRGSAAPYGEIMH